MNAYVFRFARRDLAPLFHPFNFDRIFVKHPKFSRRSIFLSTGV